MNDLFSLENTDTRYIEILRIYPKLNFVQGLDLKKKRDWHNFGAINSKNVTSPYFPKPSELLKWIINCVKNYFPDNPTRYSCP